MLEGRVGRAGWFWGSVSLANKVDLAVESLHDSVVEIFAGVGCAGDESLLGVDIFAESAKIVLNARVFVAGCADFVFCCCFVVCRVDFA